MEVEQFNLICMLRCLYLGGPHPETCADLQIKIAVILSWFFVNIVAMVVRLEKNHIVPLGIR